MVYRKKNIKKPVRRIRKRGMRKRKAIRRIPRGPFPLERVAKLRLTTGNMELTQTGGVIASLDVYANWPKYGTREAYGWDQWSTLYNNAVVLGSKITVYNRGQYNTAGTFSAFMGGIYLADDTTNFTDWQTLVEARRGSFMTVSSAAGSRAKCSAYYSAKKFFNVKDVKDNMLRLGNGVTTSVPGDAAIFKVWCQPMDKSSNGTNYFTAIVEYIVLFSEPKDVPAS